MRERTAAPHSIHARIVASYLSSAWTALIGLAFLPVYVRYLGIESYGLIGVFTTLQMWLSILDMGFSATLTRESSRFLAGARTAQAFRDLLVSMEFVYAVLAAGVATLVIVLAPLIATGWITARTLDTDTVTRSLMLMGVAVAVQWMGTLYRSGLLGLHRQVWLSGATSFFVTMKALGSVLLLMFVSPTITAFFLFHCGIAAVETAVLALQLRKAMPASPSSPRFRWESLMTIRQFASGATVIGILGTMLTQVDKLLLAKLLPLDQFGYFMLMAAIAGALTLLVVPVLNVAFPRFSEAASPAGDQVLRGEYHRFSQLLSLGVIPVSIILVLFAERIVQIWTGDSAIARAVAPPLRVWVLGTLLNSLTHIPHLAQMAYAWTRLSIVVNTVSVACSVVLLLILVPRFGVMAAAWIWVGVNVFYIVVAIPLMHRRILQGEMGAWVVRDIAAPAFAAAAPILLALKLFPQAFERPSLTLLVASGAMTLSASAAATPAGRSIIASLFGRRTTEESKGGA